MKQLEPKEYQINGNTYYVRPFPAFQAANMTGELAQMLAPILGAMAPLLAAQEERDKSDGNGGIDIGNLDVGLAAQAFAQGCISLNGDRLEYMTRKLLLGGHIVVETEDEETGKKSQNVLDKDTANEVFCGDLMGMLTLCFYVVRINFGGFFDKAAGLFGSQKEDQKSEKTVTQFRQII